MRDPERVLNSLAKQSKISMYRFERLYRILFNKEFIKAICGLLVAYNGISVVAKWCDATIVAGRYIPFFKFLLFEHFYLRKAVSRAEEQS